MPQSAPICHNCTKKYSKDPPTIPILLGCGHTYCEGCITRFGRLIKGRGNITCPECAEYHYIESLKSIKQLQINAHIYGVITAPNRRTENAVDTMLNASLETKLTDLARQQSSDEEDQEEEDDIEGTPCIECKATATVECEQCGSLPYCAKCSADAHKFSAMKNHRPQPLKPKALFAECSTHPDAVPTQCLVEDGKPVCPDCPSDGNRVDLLCEPDQMEDLIQKHNLALEKLDETDQNISTDILPAIEQDFARLKSEVRKEFGYFHGVLQAREQALLEELEKACSNTMEPLLNYRSEIVKAKKVARKNFNWIQRSKNSKRVLIGKQLDLQNIKKVIESTKCTLLVKSEKRPTLSTKKGMLATCITEFCKLNIDDVHNYLLDTPDSTVARRYNEEVPAFPQPVESDWESSLNLSQASLSSHPTEPLTVQLTAAENKDKVVVSMIYTPHRFYVQKTKDRNDLDELQNLLVKYYGLSVTAEDYLKSVTPGDLVCCKFTVDEFWYRARVLDADSNSANVLYIDYGNSETVPLTRLRRLKVQFTHCPAMAIQCSLFGIKPRDGDEWTMESVESFSSLTVENEFEMITKGKFQDHTEVDLLRCGSDIGSTREFLVFLEHACFSTNNTSPDNGAEAVDKLVEDVVMEIDSVQTGPADLTWPETEEEYCLVTISHIDSPHQFFSQFNSNSDIVQDIGKRIASHMKLAGKKFPLKELKKGIMCLALFPGDGAYYRAVILGASGFNVQVLYCDYGNSDEVERRELYEIPRSLAAPPRQSLPCTLFGVGPDQEKGWSRNAGVMFEQLVAGRLLFAGLRSVVEGKCEVSLIDTTQSNDDIDIAVELIKRGLAVSTVPPEQTIAQESSSVPLGEISLGAVNSTREATICHVTNPHLIHVNLNDFPYPPFFQNLNAAYSRFVKTGNQVIERETPWHIGDICVAYLPELELFIRAKILQFEIPQSASVVNVDQGRVSSVALNNLKILIEDFSLVRVPKFAVTCRLYDIAPLDSKGFTTEQNKKVLRFFSKRVKKGKAISYTTVMGERDPESGTWPVDLILVDPVTRKRERVSDELVKLGIAKLIVDEVEPPQGSGYQQVELGLLERHGKVIHVSSDCTIYFNPDSMRPNQERLASSLASFQRCPAHVNWQVGAACVAQSDIWFSRGLVTHIIGPKMLEVLMVDTGISMNVHVKDAYPVLLCPDIPKLAVPLRLAHIQPAWHCSDGVNWGHPAKAFLYEQVVNEKCQLDVVKKEEEFYNVTLRLSSGQDVGKAMVHKGFAVSLTPQSQSPVPPKTMSTVATGVLPTSTTGMPPPSVFGILPPQTSPVQLPPGPGLPSTSPSSLNTHHSPSTTPSPPIPSMTMSPQIPSVSLSNSQVPHVSLPSSQVPQVSLPSPHITSGIMSSGQQISSGIMGPAFQTSGSVSLVVQSSPRNSLINDETRDLIDGC